ncbi:ABC transporter ATP-binding protein [Phytohabitans kaempferiae]|uniref:ABC transporter ATP-binding protein n=1 Tax=Phytohabitans kaempferiae TaxID=1620943 RepID=A0ABV6M6K3_9ACTN
MATVVLEDLRCEFGPVVAVDSINLEVPDGSFTVLLGPSGCGKTTTLNMIAGLEEATGGRILFDGGQVQHLSPDKRDIAMVFQSYALYPNRTVLENIAFPLRMRGMDKKRAGALAAEAAGRLQLSEVLGRKPRQLSGGQQQRVALARAIVRQPKVFLLDEPLSNLDAKLRNDTRVRLKQTQRDVGGTFILVTHDQMEAMSLADLLVVMNAGRIQQAGPPLELYRRPANRFVGSFVGVPSMNQVEGEIAEGAFTASGWRVPLPGAVRTGPAVLGVRAEDLVLTPTEQGGDGRVRIVERLGTETHVIVAMAHGELTARMAGDAEIEAGQGVQVGTTTNVHIFEADEDGSRVDTEHHPLIV